MRAINHLIIHCTATRADWRAGSKTSAKVSEVRKWHKDRGWSDIGYHYLIDRDGTVATGRPVERTGAHVKGKNTGSIGIALFGGHGSSENDAFEDNFTLSQDRALRGLIDKLQSQYPNATKISGHNEFAAKACPGFRVDRWLKGNPPARGSIMQSSTVQAGLVQVTGAGGAGLTIIGSLEGYAQVVALVCLTLVILGALYIFRERIRKFAAGDR